MAEKWITVMVPRKGDRAFNIASPELDSREVVAYYPQENNLVLQIGEQEVDHLSPDAYTYKRLVHDEQEG